MAFNFDRSSSQYFQVDQTPVTGVPITVSCFFKSTDDTNAQVAVHIVDKDTENNGFSMIIAAHLGGNPVRAFVWTPGGSLAVNSTTGFTTGTWHHGATVFQSSTIVHAYIDGSSKGSITGTSQIPTGIDRIAIGRHGDSSPGAYYDGDLCEVGIWNTNLTDSEVASLAKGFSPLFIRRNNLVFYTPTINTFGGQLIDIIGGLELTPFNSPTKSEHYRIIMPHTLRLNIPLEITTKSDSITLFLQAQNDINDNINLYIKGHEIFPHRKIYFSDHGDDNGIYISNLDGSVVEKIIDIDTDFCEGLDIDHTSYRKIYYTLLQADHVKRANLDGTNQEVLVTSSSGVDGPKSLTFNHELNRIYWSEGFDPDIHYSDSDGENVVDTDVDAIAITVDLIRNKLYSIDFTPGRIRRCNFDGSNVEIIADGLSALFRIYYYSKTDKIYWSNYTDGKIQASGLTGGSVEDLVTIGLNQPWGLYIDEIGDKIYFTDVGNSNIKRCNLDGSNIEEIRPSGSTILPYAIAIDHYLPSIFMAIHGHDFVDNNITLYIRTPQSNELNLFIDGHQNINNNIDLFIVGHSPINNDIELFIIGKELQTDNVDLFIRGFDQNNNSIVLMANGHETFNNDTTLFIDGFDFIANSILLYISGIDIRNNNITLFINSPRQLTNNIELFTTGHEALNNNIELFINGFQPATDEILLIIVGHANSNNNIDLFINSHQQITDSIDLFISSFDQVTDNIPLFIWGHDKVLHQKLYTLDSANGDILMSDVDGNFLEILIENQFINALGIDVDQVNGKIYWTENVNNNISRANLDGTDIEIIVPTASGINSPGEISVNPILNRIYWIDDNGNDLKRANLDGTNIETLI